LFNIMSTDKFSFSDEQIKSSATSLSIDMFTATRLESNFELQLELLSDISLVIKKPTKTELNNNIHCV
ncbi:hypothetical protein CGJ05_22075, partial [Vibrio parahaemolyticus]